MTCDRVTLAAIIGAHGIGGEVRLKLFAESVASLERHRAVEVGGRRLNLIASGRVVNLAAGQGHPAAVMDMSFANQALSAEYAVAHAAELERKVYPVPPEIDKEIARLKLASMGIEIDTLTPGQQKYLASWEQGT